MRTSAPISPDPYASSQALWGWPVGRGKDGELWPVHCYGAVGVGRNMSPDTGSGAELYAVIGHAPRHLDRNIAVVGRVIIGIEHLSRLDRKSVVSGNSVSVRVDLGGRRIIKKKTIQIANY